MLLQPTENSESRFSISITNDRAAWGGGYGTVGTNALNYPKVSKNEKTGLVFVHLRKTPIGIEQSIRGSYNYGSVSNIIQRLNDTITIVNSFKADALNSPEVLEEVSFAQHFERIMIGGFVPNMPPNCRFMIYGLK